MNCKQGDMARLVKARFPENLNLIVEVVKPSAFDAGEGPMWVCKPAWPGRVAPWGIAGMVSFNADEFSAPDAHLRPIRPEADPVTTDCDVGVEA